MRDTLASKSGYFSRQILGFLRQIHVLETNMKLLKTNNKLVETKLKYFETNIKLRSHRLSGGPNIPGDLGRQGAGEA